MISLLRSIQKALYASRSHHNADLKLHLYVSSFLFGFVMLERWGESSMNQYLHNLWHHIPEFFEKINLRDISTDQGESGLAVIKHIATFLSNRQISNADIQIALRLTYDETLDVNWNEWTVTRESEIEKMSNQISEFNYVIPRDFILKYHDQYEFFISIISKMGFAHRIYDHKDG
jgi:hypothetical protein